MTGILESSMMTTTTAKGERVIRVLCDLAFPGENRIWANCFSIAGSESILHIFDYRYVHIWIEDCVVIDFTDRPACVADVEGGKHV